MFGLRQSLKSVRMSGVPNGLRSNEANLSAILRYKHEACLVLYIEDGAQIPNKLPSAFGILSDDAKLSFRTSPQGILRLVSQRAIPITDNNYWLQFIQLFDSPSDVFTLISPHDIRRALYEAPENVSTLVRFICRRLEILQGDHTFPSQTSMVGMATSLLSRGNERDATKEVLNCLRVLQRVLPVIFESEAEGFEKELMWKNEPIAMPLDAASASPATTSEQPQFVIDDEDEDDAAPTISTRTSISQDPNTLRTHAFAPSLAEELIRMAVDLLFFCGFTIPEKAKVDTNKVQYAIWEKGVGSTFSLGSSRELEANRIEVLRLLLVLMSKQIYATPTTVLSKPSPYTAHLVQKMPRRHVLTLLCSLVNSVVNSGHPSAFHVPYNHLVFKGEDVHELFISTCLQTLCTVLDFQSGAGDSINTNMFRYFLTKLHKPSDFTFMLDGVLAMLGTQLDASNNLLPGSKKSIPYLVEIIVFLWKTMDSNKKFKAYILEGLQSSDLTVYLLCLCMEMKDEPKHHGICKAITHILHSLSSEQGFGAQLALPVRLQLPGKWVVAGSTADFIVTSLHTLMTTTTGTFTSLYPSLVMTFSNMSPYIKHLGHASANKLLQLLATFSKASFILSDEGHPRLVFFLLEGINRILYHNPRDNPNVIYAILRSHVMFEDLGTFTLGRGLRQYQRIKFGMDDAERNVQSNEQRREKGKESTRPGEEAHEEKARLLAAEGLEDSSSNQPQASNSASQMASSVSEKVRGKMRDESQVELSDAIQRSLAVEIGRNGFVPTQEWVTSWQQGLPLDVTLLTIAELLPKMHSIQPSLSRPTLSPVAMNYLRTVQLDGILPPTPPINPRKFQWSEAGLIWMTALIWGEVYVKGMSPLGIWNGTNVRLFYVKHAPQPTGSAVTYAPRQITNAVTNVVGGIIGRSSEAIGHVRRQSTLGI